MADMAIEGLAELNTLLEQFPDQIQRKVMRGALRAGQKVVMEAARSYAPSARPGTDAEAQWGAYAGALRDSLKIGTRLRNGKVIATLVAGNKTAFYARWVEFGTKPHTITPQHGRYITLGGKAYTSLPHPGAKPNPFMRRAIDLKVGEATQAVAEYLRVRIVREMDKMTDEQDETV